MEKKSVKTKNKLKTKIAKMKQKKDKSDTKKSQKKTKKDRKSIMSFFFQKIRHPISHQKWYFIK